MIEIRGIQTDNIKEIINKLSKERGKYIDLYFPKYTVLFSSSNEDIAYDYARLAYIGHRLNESSEILKYKVVQPHLHESILFQVSNGSLDRLGETLLDLSYLYENEGDEEIFDAREELYQYISDIEENKLQAVCPEFIEIYDEYKDSDNPEQ